LPFFKAKTPRTFEVNSTILVKIKEIGDNKAELYFVKT